MCIIHEKYAAFHNSGRNKGIVCIQLGRSWFLCPKIVASTTITLKHDFAAALGHFMAPIAFKRRAFARAERGSASIEEQNCSSLEVVMTERS